LTTPRRWDTVERSNLESRAREPCGTDLVHDDELVVLERVRVEEF